MKLKRERKNPYKEIFSLNGEEYFRQIESQVLMDWSASSKSFVMATGGGTPCFYKGIEVINETGLSIFLDVPLSQLLSRLEKKTDRPLLSASDKKEMEEKLSAYDLAGLLFTNKHILQLKTRIFQS